MKHRSTNTGEKYIYKRTQRGWGVYYRVRIKRKGMAFERYFRSLDMAKEYRNALVSLMGLENGQ